MWIVPGLGSVVILNTYADLNITSARVYTAATDWTDVTVAGIDAYFGIKVARLTVPSEITNANKGMAILAEITMA